MSVNTQLLDFKNYKNVFFTADLHLFHKDIIVYENRPFKSVEEMNEEIIKRWNSVVGSNDYVFVLGDVSFGNDEETKEIIDKRLNGLKTLIMGNHDRHKNTSAWLELGFYDVSPYPVIYQDFIVLSHEPPMYYNPSSPYAYIYGHVHSTEMYRNVTANSACVSVERWDYKPISLFDLYSMMKQEQQSRR